MRCMHFNPSKRTFKQILSAIFNTRSLYMESYGFYLRMFWGHNVWYDTQDSQTSQI